MYLIQSNWEAIERETKLDPKLVVIDFCNANRHRSCMLVENGIDHSLLSGRGRWTRRGNSQEAFQRFKPNVDDHDTSDSAYTSVTAWSATPGPRSTSAITGPPVSGVDEPSDDQANIKHWRDRALPRLQKSGQPGMVGAPPR